MNNGGKNMKKLLKIMTVVIIMSACNDGMSGRGGNTAQGKNDRIDRSQRTVLDVAKYVDFTVKENNASRFTKQDVMFELNGTFKIAGGNSYITVNRADGTVTISSDDAWYKGTGGHNMYAKYVFDVQAANGDCLYIKMDNKKKAQFIIDHESMVNQAVPDVVVCVPLYGYSRNRIEVSPVMNEFIAMPSGTYWAQKGK
jgi:hypothetical protein